VGQYYPAGSSLSITNDVVEVSHPPDATQPSFYWGRPDDVDVTHTSAGSGGLRVLGGAGIGMG
jgi:hypothetical protein